MKVFIASFFGLLVLNIAIVATLSKSLNYALEQFWALKTFLIPISFAFGLQVLFYFLMRKGAFATAGIGTINTGVMIVCCAHHVADLFPFFVLGGLSSFFTLNQKYLLTGAVIFNWAIVIYLFIKFRTSHAKN